MQGLSTTLQTQHPPPEACQAFLAGQLPPGEAAAFERHLDVCAPCRKAVGELVRGRRGADAAAAPTDVVEVPRPLPVEMGQTVDGRFRIDRLLGVGGMGCVFLAHHLHLNQPVALKFMLPELAHDANAVTRFMREARAAVRLRTEHIGRVLDLGTTPEGAPYLVMEFLTGETVEQRLHREGPYPVPLAVGILRQAISAVAEAHALGIVHRDLKPANVFLARQPSGVEVVKVLDFGIAKSVHPDIEAGLEVSSKRIVVGSPHYMAPEQLLPGRTTTEAVDVWALGCTLYQMLSGQLPFTDGEGSLVNLMYAIQNTPHRPLCERSPAVGAALSGVVDACMAKKAEARLSLRQLDEALRAAAQAPGPAPRVARRPRPLVLAAAAVGALLGGLALLQGVRWLASPGPLPASATASPAPALEQAPPPVQVADDADLAPLPALRTGPRAPGPPRKKAPPSPSTGRLDQRR